MLVFFFVFKFSFEKSGFRTQDTGHRIQDK